MIQSSDDELQISPAFLFLFYVYAILCYTPSYETEFTKANHDLEPPNAL
jgi:hypothetical protein